MLKHISWLKLIIQWEILSQKFGNPTDYLMINIPNIAGIWYLISNIDFKKTNIMKNQWKYYDSLCYYTGLFLLPSHYRNDEESMQQLQYLFHLQVL